MRWFKKWLKRLVVAVLVLAAVIFVVGYAMRAHYGRLGVQARDAMTAKLDAEEPGWRYEAIRKRYLETEPPAEQNSATVVLKAHDQLPEKWADMNRAVDRAEGKTPNVRPDAAKEDAVLALKEKSATTRETARSLWAMPRGRIPFKMPERAFSHEDRSDSVFKLLAVAKVLKLDAMIASLENDPDRAILAARAAVNVGRSVGDTPILLPQLMRLACDTIGTNIAERTLAWGVPTKGLAELQEMFTEQAAYEGLRDTFQTERAALDSIFTAFQSGETSATEFADYLLQGPQLNVENTTARSASIWVYRGIVAGDHAECVRILTECITAMKSPPPERLAAFEKIQRPSGQLDRLQYPFASQLLVNHGRYVQDELRDRTRFNAAVAGIACERHRQKTGRWPASLDDIPKDILPAVPTDLPTGTPLQIRPTPTGIEIVGPHKTEPQTLFRLYNPDQRGIAP